MFPTLSLRAKILALPVVAAVGFLATLGTTVVLGRRAQSELTAIRTGYSPALEHSRKQVVLLESYQRALRDAVGASDTAAITSADTLIKQFSAGLIDAVCALNPPVLNTPSGRPPSTPSRLTLPWPAHVPEGGRHGFLRQDRCGGQSRGGEQGGKSRAASSEAHQNPILDCCNCETLISVRGAVKRAALTIVSMC